jgi:hypothetical protein
VVRSGSLDDATHPLHSTWHVPSTMSWCSIQSAMGVGYTYVCTYIFSFVRMKLAGLKGKGSSVLSPLGKYSVVS